MKLPGHLDFGVQRLGRPDKGAMRAAASAEQAASLAWGKAYATASSEVAKVAEAEGLADANLTLSERVAMDKKSIMELDAYLTNTQSVDLNAIPLPNRETGAVVDPVPAAVREAAERLGLSGNVNIFELSIEASRLHFESSSKASAEAMGEKNRADLTLTNYNKQMDNTWAISARSATKVHILQRIQHLSARADLQFNEALNDLDEERMWAITVEMEQTGIWTPDYAKTKQATIGSTVDQVAATRMYRDATSQEDLDQADAFTDRSRIAPTERMAMMKLSDQMQESQHKLEMRKQPINYGNAIAQLIDGTLTKEKVARMARNQEISGGHANTLRTALNTPAPLTSTPEVMDRFLGQAAVLRYSDEGDPTKITQRAEKLRQSALAHFTGAGTDGSPIPRSLTGKDLDTVMQLIGKYENEALGKGGQQYAVAAKSVKALTGYSDIFNKMIEGPYPAGQAYADFNSALQQYMDIDGSDPSNFVAQNAARFTADIYAMDIHKRLGRQFPQYAGDLMALLEPVNPLTGPQYTAGALLNRAQMDFLNGRLDEEQYDTLVRGLYYIDVEASMGTRTSRPSMLPGAG